MAVNHGSSNSGWVSAISHSRVHFSHYFKARLSAKSLLQILVFIHIEIITNQHNKKIEHLGGARKWPVAEVSAFGNILFS